LAREIPTAQTGGTSAVAMATRDGMRVLLLDMDPQASATAWWKRRSDESPELIHGRGDALPDILEQAQGYDLMIAVFQPQVSWSSESLLPCLHGN